VFHLDIIQLIGRFQELLYNLEKNQRLQYPAHYGSMERHSDASQAEIKRIQAQIDSLLKLKKMTQDDKVMLQVLQQQLQNKKAEGGGDIDVFKPHADFTLNARAQISATEFDDIVEEIAKYDFKSTGDSPRERQMVARRHPLLRGLRRGIGLYIDEVSLQAYKRVVLRLATKGKLAVVFSDESLAFGVNMPFRSCVFCGDMGGRLNELLVQQMSGRAGRRGLDTQGHLVFAGAKADFVRNMMLSRIPAIVGTDPRHLAIFLQEMCSSFSNPEGFSRQVEVVGQTPLCEVVRPTAAAFNMRDISRNLLLELNLIEKVDVMPPDEAAQFSYRVEDFLAARTSSPSGFRPRDPFTVAVLWMIWEMRDRLGEAILAAKMLPLLMKDFSVVNGEEEDVQFEFVASILQIIDRRPARPDGMKLSESPFVTSTTVVRREELRKRISKINTSIAVHNTKIQSLVETRLYPMVETLLVPHIDEELDGWLLHSFITGKTDDAPVHMKHEMKQRLWDLGCFLRAMHNLLYPDRAVYGCLQRVLRKCFMRIQYISADHIRDLLTFENISSYELEGQDVSAITAATEECIRDRTSRIS
jgi:hypothetical protein